MHICTLDPYPCVSSWLVMQSQDTTSKVVVKVLKIQVLRLQRKKIGDAFNSLIPVLEESRHIWDVLLHCLHDKLFTFLLV